MVADLISITVSFRDGSLVVNIIPPAHAIRMVAHCEVLDVDPIPCDIQAWINVMERKERTGG